MVVYNTAFETECMAMLADRGAALAVVSALRAYRAASNALLTLITNGVAVTASHLAAFSAAVTDAERVVGSTRGGHVQVEAHIEQMQCAVLADGLQAVGIECSPEQVRIAVATLHLNLVEVPLVDSCVPIDPTTPEPRAWSITVNGADHRTMPKAVFAAMPRVETMLTPLDPASVELATEPAVGRADPEEYPDEE